MKKLCIICIVFLSSLAISAQELKVANVEMLDEDNYAVDSPRYDNNNVLCAILKVYFNQKEYGQLQFNSPLMLGSADYNNGCYIVYVADKTKSITLYNNMSAPFTINFRDYGVSVESGKTYRIDVDAIGLKNTQTIVFNMIPLNGYIDINGKQEQVEDGSLQIELSPGDYPYKAYDGKSYCIDKEGNLRVLDSDISETKIISIKLEQRMAKVTFKCNDANAILYIDNEEYGTSGVKLVPLGEHDVRVVGKNSKDYLKKCVIEKDRPTTWNIKLDPSEYLPVTIYGGPYLYIDNREVKNWRSGKTLMLESGRHLFTVSSKQNPWKKKDKSSRVIKIKQDTRAINLDHIVER